MNIKAIKMLLFFLQKRNQKVAMEKKSTSTKASREVKLLFLIYVVMGVKEGKWWGDDAKSFEFSRNIEPVLCTVCALQV